MARNIEKVKLRKIIQEESLQQQRKGALVISCKNKEYNFYSSGKFDDNDPKALASHGWKHRKSYIARDFFTINAVSTVSLIVLANDKETDELFKMLEKANGFLNQDFACNFLLLLMIRIQPCCEVQSNVDLLTWILVKSYVGGCLLLGLRCLLIFRSVSLLKIKTECWYLHTMMKLLDTPQIKQIRYKYPLLPYLRQRSRSAVLKICLMTAMFVSL